VSTAKKLCSLRITKLLRLWSPLVLYFGNQKEGIHFKLTVNTNAELEIQNGTALLHMLQYIIVCASQNGKDKTSKFFKIIYKIFAWCFIFVVML